MKIKNSRILVLAAVACTLLGPSLAASAADSLPALDGLRAEAGPNGPVLHLQSQAAMDTVHYSPQPGVWVVELPEATWQEGSALVSAPGLGVERAELAHVEEFGKRVSRLTVWLNAPAQLEVTSTGGGLELEFTFLDASGYAAEPAVVREEPPVPASTVTVPEPEPASSSAPAADAPSASSLFEVEAVRSGQGVTVELRGDGVLEGRAFTLTDPLRLVVDFPGVVNRAERNGFQINSDLVRRVRVAQFQAVPEPITRLVVDLEGDVDYDLRSLASGAVLAVGTTGQAPAAVPAVPVVASAETMTISNLDGPVAATRPHAPPPQAEEVVQPPVTVTSVVEPMTDPAPAAPAPAAPEVPAPAPERNPWVADQSQLIEQAAAAQVIETQAAADEFAETTVDNQASEFTGEPITLTLKDADIKDVLRTFSALTNLNIVLDPGVSGSVTVELRNVPWDQALDLILRINGLGYVLENNVLRVAPITRLQQEKKDEADYELDQENALPLKTVVKPLAYAKAQEVGRLLGSDSYLLSERGSVVVDMRTNTLIIRDTVERVEGALRLIEQLDQPTPQVVIEGRIVETTRNYAYRLGVEWGFSGVADAEHGNTTGLTFPNSGTIDGQVNLAKAYNGIIGFTFSDILNTFNLDFQLMAGEEDGLLKVVSAPRVTTQNLMKAKIQSGLQIPVQTVANNTVTVQYVDATLNLEVTPQITAEGTVNLDVNIAKRAPVGAFTVQGGQNAPIFTRDVQSQLLVRDGGTTVIGGIYQIEENYSTNRVPFLGKIPVIKHLFQSREDSTTHDELLIFITPRIVKY